MKTPRIFLCISLIFLSACAGNPATNIQNTGAIGSQEITNLTVMTHDNFAVSEKVIQDFERQNSAQVTFLKSGDAGAALNRAVLSKDAPFADVFFGIDNTFLSRAIDEGIFEPYQSPLLKEIPDSFKLDRENQALPIDFGDVCINYDIAFFKNANLAVPQKFEDLTKQEYKGMLVVENPATSSPGLAFLLATIDYFGKDQYLGFWKAMRSNGMVVVNDWSTAYYANFSGSSGKGPQPMVVSYASSPVAEVYFAASPVSKPPTASIVEPKTCFRQIEFVGILKGTKNGELARKFVDFMLDKEFQEDIPLQMFMYPVNSTAELPDVYKEFAQIPAVPAQMDPGEITNNRASWIQAWTEVVLR